MIVVFISFSAVFADPDVLILAAREPVALEATGSTVTVIDSSIEALALPQLVDLLRLSPGVSISRSGPTGSQTQVRLRGAESNHTLVFVDGIETNDPASSGDFRWETLAADGIQRVEVLRGPQSALWGSEAIGGVVAVTSRAPAPGMSAFGSAEAGSFGTYRAAAGLNVGSENGGIAVQASGFETTGIDSFAGGPVERDGYENAALSVKASVRPAAGGEIGIVARYTSSLSAFDGFDDATFLRADTADATRIRSVAVRGFAKAETSGGRWRHEVFGTVLSTDNINRNGAAFLNRTDAKTFRTGYQSSIDFKTAGADHRLTAAAEYRSQQFRAADTAFFGGTDQRVSRGRGSAVADYHITAGPLAMSASLRHDDNDSFGNATTWRAAARAALGDTWSLHGSAGEGVTDPTFTEQFGFFPGSFVGNPALTPERAFGYDAGVSYAGDGVSADVTAFETDLENEIVATFDFATFLTGVANATGRSKRRGVEASVDIAPADWLTIGGSYTWLDADEAKVAGTLAVREVRRARHTANLLATAEFDFVRVALALNYVGKRRDIDFDRFPARDVTLGDYVLGTLSIDVPLGERLEFNARAENLFDARYQDVFGYRTQGISLFGGVRVRWGN